MIKIKNGFLYNGDVLSVLKELPDNNIDCVITSPPYWGLRFYGNEINSIWDGDKNCVHDWDIKEINIALSVSDKSGLNDGKGVKNNAKIKNLDGKCINGFCKKCGAWYGQLGLEPSFELYLKHLLIIFDEIYRVLKPTGTCWVNLGDTYYGGGNNRGNTKKISEKQASNKGAVGQVQMKWNFKKYKQKSLCMIPERFAIGMIERGWILRNQIIWHKPNAIPESVKDRFTKDFEKIFFFVKQKKYYFEQQIEPYSKNSKIEEYKGKAQKDYKTYKAQNHSDTKRRIIESMKKRSGRNKRTVWSITTKPFKGAHFAVFPPEIPEICIKAGCPEGGVVLDPFMGSGTTAVVAEKLKRKWIGVELNTNYVELIKKRIESI